MMEKEREGEENGEREKEKKEIEKVNLRDRLTD